MIKLLAKADNEVLSHCRCEASLASVPGQLDCPWCGCGWLIGCTDCRKAFTFACVVEVETTYETFVRGDRQRGGYTDYAEEDIRLEAEALEGLLADFAPGQTVVYLDGAYFALDEAVEQFEGLYANHSFARTPHSAALETPDQLTAVLGDKAYWLGRERPDRGTDA
jgi:hypothetical protein